jgi:hypothetical protein
MRVQDRLRAAVRPAGRDLQRHCAVRKGQGITSMDVPPYLHINQDPKLSGPTLTIADSTDAKQKAMWGMSLPHPSPDMESNKP